MIILIHENEEERGNNSKLSDKGSSDGGDSSE